MFPNMLYSYLFLSSYFFYGFAMASRSKAPDWELGSKVVGSIPCHGNNISALVCKKICMAPSVWLIVISSYHKYGSISMTGLLSRSFIAHQHRMSLCRITSVLIFHFNSNPINCSPTKKSLSFGQQPQTQLRKTLFCHFFINIF